MATAYRTSTDLVNKALANLGVLASGQPTDPEDFAYALAEVDSILRKLNQLDIVPVADPNNIPGAWFQDLADILTGEIAQKFGSKQEDQINLISKGLGGPPSPIEFGGGAAALSLKQQLRGRPTYEVQRVTYF